VFEPTGQSHIVCGILPQLNLTLEILCSVLEITFLKELHRSRFWKKVGDDTYQYSPPKENLERGKRIIAKVEAELSKK
jgi:hypothetical protein